MRAESLKLAPHVVDIANGISIAGRTRFGAPGLHRTLAPGLLYRRLATAYLRFLAMKSTTDGVRKTPRLALSGNSFESPVI